MAKERDYYEILGVSRNATNSEIESAYRIAAKKYHPDANRGNSDANQKMMEVNAAYQVLSKPDKRSQYDMHLSQGRNTKDFNYQDYDNTEGFQQSGFRGDDNFFSNFSFNFENTNSSGFGFKDIFSSFFGGGSEDRGNDGHDSAFYPNQDIVIALELTLSEWFNGTNKTISYDVNEKCLKCTKQKVQCGVCNGRGDMGNTIYGRIMCNGCGGQKYRDVIRLCGHCNQGSIKQRASKTLSIPRFMSKRYVIKQAGHFSAKTQVKGNLILDIKVLAHERFKLDGVNIYFNAEIGLEEYIYGTNLKFRYLDNTTINLSIAPFSELTLCLDKKGAQIGGKYGNLYVDIKIKNNIGKHVAKDMFMSNMNIKPLSDSFILR